MKLRRKLAVNKCNSRIGKNLVEYMNLVSNVKARIERYKKNILFKRLFTVLSIDILVKVSGLILLPVYLRLMTQEEYGLYGYLLSIIMTFSIVLNFGLYIPLSKFYHDYQDAEKRGKLLFTISLLLVIMLASIIFPVYFFGWDYELIKILFKNPVDYKEYRGAVLIVIIVSVFSFMLTSFFFTSEKLKHLKRYNIFRIIFINVGTVFFLYLFRNIDSVRIRLQTTYIIELILFVFFYYYYIKEVWFKFNKKAAITGLKLGLPVMVSALFGIGINFSDKFFLEKYSSFKDLSYYYLAVSLASAIPLIFASLQNAWLPLFLKEKDIQKNIETTNKLMHRLVIGFLILSVIIVVGFKIILKLGIIQSKYSETIGILPLLLISQIISSLVSLHTNYLIYFERTHIASITGLILCIISVGLSLLLIPRYKVYGAVTVSLISNIIYLGLYYFIIKMLKKKYLRLNTHV